MQIVVNGEETAVPATCTVASLLEQMALTGRRVAVEVNGEIVPRSAHGTHQLKEQDRVEVVFAIGGGSDNAPDVESQRPREALETDVWQ